MDSIIEKIINQKIVPLFYDDSYDVSYELVAGLYNAGIRVVEYTNRGAKALENFKKLKEVSATDFPELSLGIGTVKNIAEMDDYISAGSEFIITPLISEELVKHAIEKNTLLIPGCITPSEVNIAYQNGLKMVKIFPADTVGKNYIKSIKAVFPGMNFMPTGGVKADVLDINEWFKGGAVAVGLGSSLITSGIYGNDLTDKVKQLLQELNS